MEASLFDSFGWRDVVLAVVVAVAIYMVVAIVGLLRLRRKDGPDITEIEDDLSEPVFAKPPAEPPLDAPTRMADFDEETILAPRSAPPSRPPVLAEPPGTHADEFGERLFRAAVENDIQHLRGDLARVRDEMATLRSEIAGLRQQFDRQQQAVHSVSPLYSEAMGLALQGLDARDIADRCGISIGEAELVVALTRKEHSGYPENEADDDGTDPR